jgi:hypothetical protein
MGGVAKDFWDDLNDPGTQAIVVAAISALVAFVCFFLADRWVSEDEAD